MAEVNATIDRSPEEINYEEAREAWQEHQRVERVIGEVAYFCAVFGFPHEVEEHMRKEVRKINPEDFGQMGACLRGAADTFADYAEGESLLVWPQQTEAVNSVDEAPEEEEPVALVEISMAEPEAEVATDSLDDDARSRDVEFIKSVLGSDYSTTDKSVAEVAAAIYEAVGSPKSRRQANGQLIDPVARIAKRVRGLSLDEIADLEEYSRHSVYQWFQKIKRLDMGAPINHAAPVAELDKEERLTQLQPETNFDDEPAHVQLAHKWSAYLKLDESLTSALVSFFDPKSGAKMSDHKASAVGAVREVLLKDGYLREDLDLSPQATRHIRKMLGIYIQNNKPQLTTPCTMGIYLDEQRRKNPDHKVKELEEGVYEAFLSALTHASQKGLGESVDVEPVSDSAEVLHRVGEKLGLTEAESFALYQRALFGTGAYREMSDTTAEVLRGVQARMTQFSRDDFKTEMQLKVLRGFTRTVLGGPMDLDEIAKELKIEDGAQGVERLLIEAMRVLS